MNGSKDIFHKKKMAPKTSFIKKMAPKTSFIKKKKEKDEKSFTKSCSEPSRRGSKRLQNPLCCKTHLEWIARKWPWKQNLLKIVQASSYERWTGEKQMAEIREDEAIAWKDGGKWEQSSPTQQNSFPFRVLPQAIILSLQSKLCYESKQALLTIR